MHYQPVPTGSSRDCLILPEQPSEFVDVTWSCMLVLGRLANVHTLRMKFYHWALIVRLVTILNGNQFCELPYTMQAHNGFLIQSNPDNSYLALTRFPVDCVHTFTVILPSLTRTLDNSNLSLTRTNFHFPSSNFVYNFTHIT